MLTLIKFTRSHHYVTCRTLWLWPLTFPSKMVSPVTRRTGSNSTKSQWPSVLTSSAQIGQKWTNRRMGPFHAMAPYNEYGKEGKEDHISAGALPRCFSPFLWPRDCTDGENAANVCALWPVWHGYHSLLVCLVFNATFSTQATPCHRNRKIYHVETTQTHNKTMKLKAYIYKQAFCVA